VDLIDDHLGLAAAPLVQLDDVKAARGAHRFADVPGLHLGHQIQDELRQLGALAPAELTAVERGLSVRIGDGQLAEVLALGGAVRQITGLARDFGELLRGGGLRQGQQDVRDVEFIVGGGALLAREILFQLVRAHVDVGDHVALAQRAQHHFLAHLFAIGLVVDALGLQRGGQLVEGNLVARGNLLQRAVQLFVGYREAHTLGALHLDLRQDQPLEHLLSEHAGGWHLHLLFLQALGHRVDLRVELALEDQAVVDHRRDAIQQFAVHAEIARLRQGDRNPQDSDQDQTENG